METTVLSGLGCLRRRREDEEEEKKKKKKRNDNNNNSNKNNPRTETWIVFLRYRV